MDAIFEKLMNRLGSKRAGLGVILMYLLSKMAETDSGNTFWYAVLMTTVVGGFLVEEYLEKGRDKGDDGSKMEIKGL